MSVALPKATELALKLSANGNIAAWQEAIVGSESGGLKLTEVRAQVGDVVRSGQVLAVFSTDTVQADVAQAQAALAQAQAQADEAKGNADRARALQSTGVFSQQQTQQILAAERAADARVQAARAQLQTQHLRLRHTQVLAPDAGVISARSATVGAVTPAGAELFRLIRQGRLEWQAEVTEAELKYLRPGVEALVTTASGETVRGRVRAVAPTVNAQTRNALVYVDLQPRAASGSAVRAGGYARGEFKFGRSKALTVPQSAVVMRDGFSYVFSPADNGRVRQLKVQTGRRLDSLLEITQGLAANTPVVTQGAGFLQEGDLVKVVAQPTPAAAAAALPVKR